ncbi:peptide/nickel transport system permease protein [Actinocorallia herbida]|uniref:Peptide/nickel transport system permease protein n=1 Tax=Actinocorallia herbida TaxID=58109 RepID=A0A3N1D3J7_9ACTN|nr:dipeptide/oligopeptide/nickel ABC transporter permease/ATP-binding protein [Actinocorallia herbida]ROO87628.1 peptide/nickel transport system permease protein [Actinocorallia herbida]
MNTFTEPVQPSAAPEPTPGRRKPKASLYRPGTLLAIAWLVLIMIASATARGWVPFPVDHQDLTDALAGPSSRHWLGTDELGRDLFSRIVTSGWISIGPALLAVAVAFGVGVPMALLAAEHGRKVEWTCSRIAELLLSLPTTVILLAFVGAVGIHVWAIMAVLGLLLAAPVYRILLALAQSLRTRLYVDAAKVNGVGSLLVNVRHVLPGMATTIAVQAAQLFALGILIEAGLAFMGYGPAIPAPSWGGLIGGAQQHIYDAPWMMVPTGVVLALTVIAANQIADALSGERERNAPVRRPARRAARLPVPAQAAGEASTRAEGALLEVRDLRVGVVEGTELVTGVSVSVRSGTVLGLVGESGCGKTMTARSLMGLLPDGVEVCDGSIRFQGRELVGLSDRQYQDVRGRDIAMISQEPMVALDPMFTIGYQLVQPIRRFRGVGRGEARRIALDLLAQVGIVDPARILRSHPHALSGGMAQRVCIALALTGSPKLLIADEPTTALDVTVQAEILSLLRSLVHNTGLSVVLVSHDLGVVADLCDDVAVMYAGQVLESGTVAEVLDQAAHPYTGALMSANPHIPQGEAVPDRLPSIRGTVPAPKDWPTGCRFASRCPLSTHECHEPVALAPAHGGGTVRCIHPLVPAPATAGPNESGVVR